MTRTKEHIHEEILNKIHWVFRYGGLYSLQDKEEYPPEVDIILQEYRTICNEIKDLLKELTNETQHSS